MLLVSDVHGEAATLRRIVEAEAADALLCAGDLGDAKRDDDYAGSLAAVRSVLERSDLPVGAVPGNTDLERECVDALRARGLNLHDEVRSFGRVVAAGYGGATARARSPFDPSGAQIRDAMLALAARMAGRPRVAVVHQPPVDTRLDVVDGGVHVGDPAVRELFERAAFDLAVTGHIHESRGRDEIGDTLLVNPGAVVDGCYAVAELRDRAVDLRLCEL
jgi:hypothetical protein